MIIHRSTRTHRRPWVMPPLLLLLLLLGLGLAAELPALEIVNDTDDLFYYSVQERAVDASGERVGDELEDEQLRDLLLASSGELRYIPPQSLVLEADSAAPESERLLLGLRVQPGNERYRMIYGFIDSDVVYVSDLERNDSDVYSWDVDIPLSPVRIDGRFVEWVNVPELAAWPLHLRPLRIVRGDVESSEGTTEIAYEQSLFWGRSASLPTQFKAQLGPEYLYVHLSASSPFTEAFTAYITVASEGGDEYGLEFYLEDQARLVFLRSTDGTPNPVGDLSYSRFFLEARIAIADLPFVPGNESVLTLATAVYDGGLFERFVIGEISAERIANIGGGSSE